MDIWPFVIVALLIFMNGMFVAAEFAIVATPRASVERRASKGEKLAHRVFRLLTVAHDQDRFIATAQLGITLASLGLGMYGERRIAEILEPRLDHLGLADFVSVHTIASIVALSALTYLHIVLGEMVPKSLALQRPERVAFLVARPMFGLGVVFYPLVSVLHAAGKRLLGLLGIDRRKGSADRFYTPEELDEVVRESAERGLLAPESGQMLRELLEFGDLTAREVMVPRVRVVGIEVGTEPAELEQILKGSPHTRYPVHAGDMDHIVGHVHIKDLVRLLRASRPISESDTRRLPYVPETTPLDAVLETMRRERTQMAVVLDEHGGTAGLVTIEDLFEEIVGEIQESGRPESLSVDEDATGVLRVAGTVRVIEVGEALEMDLEHPDVDSVSGLILALLDRVPHVGDEVEYRGVRFRVTATQGNGVRECEVRRE